MSHTDDTARAFIDRYGRALSSDDLSAIVACWEVSALVISDEGALAILEAAEIEGFFAGAVQWYRAQGLVATRPEEVPIEPLGERLASVDVTWSAVNAAGEVALTDHPRYVLRIAEDCRG